MRMSFRSAAAARETSQRVTRVNMAVRLDRWAIFAVGVVVCLLVLVGCVVVGALIHYLGVVKGLEIEGAC